MFTDCVKAAHYALRSLGGHVSCPSFSPPSPGRLVVPSPSTVSATEREFASSSLYLNAARPRGIPAVDRKRVALPGEAASMRPYQCSVVATRHCISRVGARSQVTVTGGVTLPGRVANC